MPLLQEAQPKRDLMLSSSREIKPDPDDVTSHPLNRVTFPSLPNTAMFTPSQLLVASQTAALMAASGLGLQANPAFFHPGLFASAWSTPQSPPSPPRGDPLSPALKSRKHNNNNNVVSSSVEIKAPKRKPPRKIEEETAILPLSPPTSGSSPPSSSETVTKDTARDKQFTCGVCNRSFGYKHVLQNHERTHTGEKPFQCPECHKRFTRDHHLKTHLRLHTGERPYSCEFCDRQFVQVANLRRHLRVHTGERPYSCEYCTARFSDSNQLKAHVLIHKGQKPFECEKCQGRFRRRHHLLHHKCSGKDQQVERTSNVSSPFRPTTIESPFQSDISDEVYPEEEARKSFPEEVVERKPQREIRRIVRPVEPLISLPLRVALPEQTEPEDLSMSTGLHSHSSGDSPLSRSPSSPGVDVEEEYELDDAAALFLQRRPLS